MVLGFSVEVSGLNLERSSQDETARIPPSFACPNPWSIGLGAFVENSMNRFGFSVFKNEILVKVTR